MFYYAGDSFGASSDDALVEAIQYRILGYNYQRQGNPVKAMENYKLAVKRNPF